MRPRKRYELDSALQGKGFRRRDSNHIFYEMLDCGKLTDIRTKISHSHREVSKGLQRQMARDLYLSSGQFDDLIECPLSHQDHKELLRRDRHL